MSRRQSVLFLDITKKPGDEDAVKTLEELTASCDWNIHAKRIFEHYAHAREKHPYFCDFDPMMSTRDFAKKMKVQLDNARSGIEISKECGEVEWIDLLECEKFEAVVAMSNSDKAKSVDELYRCAVVCLRTIDVIEGRQKLGKQEETK